MTIRETDRWLRRGKFIKTEIKHLRKRALEAEELATSVTSSPDAIVVQGSKDPHKFDKVVEINDELYNQISKCERILGEIQQAIDILEEPRERYILGRFYIDDIPVRLIAAECHCTDKNIYFIIKQSRKIIRNYLSI